MDAQHVGGEIHEAADEAMLELLTLGQHMRDSGFPAVVSVTQRLLRIKLLADEIGGAK
jgi:hypothetical protein